MESSAISGEAAVFSPAGSCTGAGFAAASAAEFITSILLMNEVPGSSALAEAASKHRSTSPTRNICPGFNIASVIFFPSMNVPFVESRSRTANSPSCNRTSQCLPETEVSTICNVFPSPRPMVIHPPLNSSGGAVTPFVMTTSLAISIASDHSNEYRSKVRRGK